MGEYFELQDAIDAASDYREELLDVAQGFEDLLQRSVKEYAGSPLRAPVCSMMMAAMRATRETADKCSVAYLRLLKGAADDTL